MVFFVSTGAILLAFAVTGIIFFSYGVNPGRAYAEILGGSLGSIYGLGETLRRAIPLLLCGVGLVLAFRAFFWNIGAEGQLLMGAVAATGIALFVGIPDPFLIPAMFFAGFFAGAIWGLIPAMLRAFLCINEVITTLMMNYIAMYLVLYLIHGPWKGPQMRGFAYTNTFPEAAWLPTLGTSRVHWPTLIIGLALVALSFLLLSRTKLGYEIRVVGENPEAARYAGISYGKTILLVMFLSGGAAGLAGVGEVAGIHHMLRHPNQISLGYGYTAIIVAWLARGSPLVTIFTALLLGVIFAGGDVIKVSLGLPFQIIGVFNGLILFFLIGSELLMYYRITVKKDSLKSQV